MLVMNTGQADLTWVLDSSIISGAQFVNDNAAEFSVQGGKAVIYSNQGRNIITQQAVTASASISLSGLAWSSAAAEADTSFVDTSWTASAQPQSMDACGFGNGYGWYRTTYTAASASTQTLALPTIKDASVIFWNGKTSGTTVQVKNGRNVLAILACQFGRDKLFAFAGPVGGQAKGVLGQVKLGSTTLANWRFRGGLNGLDEAGIMGIPTNWDSFAGRTWTTGGIPADNVPRFYKADFTYTVNPALHQTFRLTSGSISKGVAWINGHNLGRIIENMSTFAPLYVPECWLKQSNTLVIFSLDGKSPQNLALTAQESYAVKAITSTGIRIPYSGRTIGNVALVSMKSTDAVVFDMKGRIVARVARIARASEGMALETIIRSKCLPGMYIIRANGTARYFLVSQRMR